MRIFVPALAAVVLSTSPAARAAEPQAGQGLMTRNGCLACHGVDQKIVGPGFKEIALKYRGDATAAGNLAEKVKAGGRGVWGDIPMPPNGHVKDDDIRTIVDWVLALD